MSSTTSAAARRSLLPTLAGAALTLVVVILLGTGCTSVEYSRDVERIENQSGFGHLYTGDSNTEYWIGIGDGIKVQSFDNSELSFNQIVGPDGKITLPLIGDVKVAGLTVSECRERLTDLLLEYYREVDLFVTVPFKNSKKIYIVGQVRRGGVARFEGDMTVMDLLARYPPGQSADTESIWLIRGDPRSPQRYRVNLEEIQELGVTTTNYVLREDDIIYVPPTSWGAVGLWLDDALYPVRVITNTFGLLFRAAIIPARLEGFDEVYQRAEAGQNTGGGGRGDFFL
jgi:polysaccharide export outer membrane protein